LINRPEIGNSVDIDISKEKFMEMEVVNMSDFEMLFLIIVILSIIVKLLLEIIKGKKYLHYTSLITLDYPDFLF